MPPKRTKVAFAKTDGNGEESKDSPEKIGKRTRSAKAASATDKTDTNGDDVQTVTKPKRQTKKDQNGAVDVKIDLKSNETKQPSKRKDAPKPTKGIGDAKLMKTADNDKAVTNSGTITKSQATDDIPTLSKGKKGKSGAKSKNSQEKPEEDKMKTIIIKGKAPVDPECAEKAQSSHIYCEENDIYDAMLNQTNLQDNNNKFYLMQVLEDDNLNNYFVWFRWGRVGVRGQSSLTPCGSDITKAKNLFEKKFQEKTKNHWSERECFEKVAGKYDLLAMDYTGGDVEPVKETKPDVKPKGKPKSTLDERLQCLIELIFNIKAMEATVMEMKYNAKKAPLGKLTVEQVTAGYSALKEVEKCILGNKLGKELLEACNAFYTRIPHDFGMKRPPLITTTEELKAKIDLLQALGDIQVAMTILNEGVAAENNPIDSHYNSLNCGLKAVDKKDEMFAMIDEYLQNTHASTHKLYKLELVDVFDCDRHAESAKFKDVGNRMLLWHGSRLTNAVGILKQGLRIAPPEAPSTGYMFGKGVYFADMSSKSANYCYTNRKQNEGILYLCEVAVGTPRKLLDSDYNADKLPKGFNSVLGQGSVAPDPKVRKTLPNGTLVPLGKGVDSGVKNPNGYTLNYNEYIVYNVSQIKLKYVLRVNFQY